MDKGDLAFLTKTVEQSTAPKHAILTNEAPTIIEKFNGPKLVSKKKKKKIRIISSGGKAVVKTVVALKANRAESDRNTDESSSVAETSDAKSEKYIKGDVNRFSDYKGVSAPKDKNISFKKDMSSTNNNGFMAAIVEQTGGVKSAVLSNDAPTIVEKYQTPMARPGHEEPEYDDADTEMYDFSSIESMDLPTVWLNTKQLPDAQGLVVGDKVYLMVEAEVANYSFNENVEGIKREEYTFKLKKGCIKKDD